MCNRYFPFFFPLISAPQFGQKLYSLVDLHPQLEHLQDIEPLSYQYPCFSSIVSAMLTNSNASAMCCLANKIRLALCIFFLAFFNVGIAILCLAQVQSVSFVIFSTNVAFANCKAMRWFIFGVHTTSFFTEVLFDVFNHLPLSHWMKMMLWYNLSMSASHSTDISCLSVCIVRRAVCFRSIHCSYLALL